MPFAIALSERARILLDRSVESASAVAEAARENVRLAVEAALDRGETHYTDRPGILPLRERIAALLKQRFMVEIDAKSDIIVTCGVTEARFVAIQQLLQPGDTLAAPASGEKLFGAALLRDVQLQDVVSTQAQMVYLKSSAAEEFRRSHLASLSPTATVLFEVDDAESGFHPGQIDGFQHRTVTVGSLGEEGWRIGYLASPGGPSASLRDFKQALTICSTNLSQWACLAQLGAR